MSASTDAIRVGVVGVGRGQTFARGAEHAGMTLVALCDTWEERLSKVAADLDVTGYTDFGKFLEHDLDAVVLANYCHEHAPFAVKALRAGKHVMSECLACSTPAEGVELVRAVQETGLTYFFAENYPYMAVNQEMRRLYQAGVVGEFRYGEGEYVHPDPPDVKMARSCGVNHWRNWLPATYYCTHSIAPVMFITDTRPVSISGHVVPYDHGDPSYTDTAIVHDSAAVLILHMDNGAVMKSLHGGLRGHANFTRIHGNKGLMEAGRGPHAGMLRLYREPWEKPEGEPAEQLYRPDFPEHHAQAMRAGHGGGDFFTNYHFANAIRTGEPPYLDVYCGVQMSLCGVQGWRSALEGGAPKPVPDFRDDAQLAAFENDRATADPTIADRLDPAERLPSSLDPSLKPTARGLAASRKVWASRGYEGE